MTEFDCEFCHDGAAISILRARGARVRRCGICKRTETRPAPTAEVETR